jgi:hypothetical protein
MTGSLWSQEYSIAQVADPMDRNNMAQEVLRNQRSKVYQEIARLPDGHSNAAVIALSMLWVGWWVAPVEYGGQSSSATECRRFRTKRWLQPVCFTAQSS